MDAYLSKPVSGERIAEAIAQVLNVAPPAPAPAAEPVKTFSDDEILASVKAPEAVIPIGDYKPKTETAGATGAAGKVKPSRKVPDNQTRLWVSVGEEQGVVPIDFVNAVAGETGLPGKVVGKVDVRERHTFVDVASEHANGIIAKLNRAEIKGQKIKVKVA